MGNNKFKILVVEDDKSVSRMLQTVLENNGYQVLTAYKCQQGILMLSSHVPDLVVLDLGLPDLDGEEFIRIVRKSSMVPIIVLSARTDEMDKVMALDLGANDYITKPFGTEELLARIRTSLRITRTMLQTFAPGKVFSLGSLVIDYESRRVCLDGNLIHMTQTEYNILFFLSLHPGKVMTYSAIINAIWGSMDEGCIKKLQVNMANIRRKLGCKPGETRYIVNELGVGYRMLDHDD